MRAAALCLLLACAKGPDADALRADADAVAAAHKPELDALAARVAALKQTIGNQRPGWQNMLRTAQAANDDLGLWPFEQVQPPGPGWKPSPASLLGIAAVVHARADTLDQVDDLQRLIADEKARYDKGIRSVDDRLAQVERWVAANR